MHLTAYKQNGDRLRSPFCCFEKSEGLPQTADNPSGKEKRECYRMVPRHMVFATVIMQYRKAMTRDPA